MSPTLMSDNRNANLRLFSSKYQAKNFCLFKQHGKAKSREACSFRPSYLIMNETRILKLCLIMSFKTALYLFRSNSLDLSDLSLQNLIMSDTIIRRRPNSQTSNLGWTNSTPTTLKMKSLSILANEPYLYLHEIYTHYPRLSKNITPTGYFMSKKEYSTHYPNTTQTPNFIFDNLMSRFVDHPARFFVLCAIVRKTYGWRKDEDSLSLSQLIKMTGLSKNAIKSALLYLSKKNIIKIISKGHGRKISKYRCLLHDFIDDEINNPDPSEGQLVTPQRVNDYPSEGQSMTPRESTNDTYKDQPVTLQNSINSNTKLNIQKENTNASGLQIMRDLQTLATQNNVTFDNSLSDKKYFNYLISDRSATNEVILAIAQKLIDVKKYFRTEGFKYSPSWAQKPLSFKTIHTHYLDIQEYSISGKSGVDEDWKSGRTRIV
jgi:phage replication O-like protein O